MPHGIEVKTTVKIQETVSGGTIGQTAPIVPVIQGERSASGTISCLRTASFHRYQSISDGAVFIRPQSASNPQTIGLLYLRVSKPVQLDFTQNGAPVQLRVGEELFLDCDLQVLSGSNLLVDPTITALEDETEVKCYWVEGLIIV